MAFEDKAGYISKPFNSILNSVFWRLYLVLDNFAAGNFSFR